MHNSHIEMITPSAVKEKSKHHSRIDRDISLVLQRTVKTKDMKLNQTQINQTEWIHEKTIIIIMSTQQQLKHTEHDNVTNRNRNNNAKYNNNQNNNNTEENITHSQQQQRQLLITNFLTTSALIGRQS